MKNKAIVTGLYIADQDGTFVSRPLEYVTFDFGGIIGDRHYGMTYPSNVRQPMYPKGTEILNRRQLSVLSIEELKHIASHLQIEYINAEWLGANLVISGLEQLTHLPVNTRLLFPSGAGIICEGENAPCTLAGSEVQKRYPDKKKLASKFVKAASGKRGIVCSVERPGIVNVNDSIEIIYPD